MNTIAIKIKNAFTAIAAARPLSHLAAVTLLGTSVYAVHAGAEGVLPAGLAAATTAAMIGAEWLQWTALGRLAKIEEAQDDMRAMVLKWQCAGIGCLQVMLYTLAVQNFAGEAGQDWGQGWALAGTVAIAALFAALNFVAKWTSCDELAERAPARRAAVHSALFSEALPPALPAPADDLCADDVGVIRLADRLAQREAQHELDGQAKAIAGRTPDERLQLAIKRLQLRHRRALKRAA